MLAVAATLRADPAAAAGPAGDAGNRLHDVESRIERDHARDIELGRKGKALAREVAALRAELVASAAAMQSHEARLSRLERKLRNLRDSEADKRGALDRRRGELQRTLAALQRLATYPPEAMIARPGGAGDTVKSALLLRTVIPHIESRAMKLSGELAELIVLRARISQRRRQIQRARAALEREREHMADLAGRKARVQLQTESKRRRVAARLGTLAAEAKTLRELIGRLRDEARRSSPEIQPSPDGDATTRARLVQPEGLRKFSAGRGEITIPVVGRTVRVFDAEARNGTYNKGILITSRAGAQVVAPYDGRVAFAGLFRGYGQILIIEHGEGYHTLLAGLRRIDGVVNQWLLAGEPVGIMGASASGAPTLYLEIRLNGQPIDPLPWLAINQARVSG
ncbi:MAG: murein hydrolase activator EnvC family protein [Alphaproteobacteria bacterium]